MTIASKLTTINNALSGIKTAIEAKGVTPSGDITTYATAIGDIPSGASSKFGVSIDNIIGDVDSNGVLGSPSPINGMTFTGVTEIGFRTLLNAFAEKSVSGLIAFPDLTTVDEYGLSTAFTGNQITSVDLSSLTTVGNSGLSTAFTGNKITSVDLSSLTTVGNNGLNRAFENNQITSVDLSSLTTVSDSGLSIAFANNQITSVDLSSLTTIGMGGLVSAFANNQITSVDLSSLTTIGMGGLNSAFKDNKDSQSHTTLTSVSFPALTSQSFGTSTNQFANMLSGDDEVTVHFPSNLQSVIGGWPDVKYGFSGNNTIILFDLPATK